MPNAPAIAMTRTKPEARETRLQAVMSAAARPSWARLGSSAGPERSAVSTLVSRGSASIPSISGGAAIGPTSGSSDGISAPRWSGRTGLVMTWQGYATAPSSPRKGVAWRRRIGGLP